MVNHAILGGSVQLYRRGDGRTWHCSASVDGRQRRATTREQDLALAKQAAEDWYLDLRGKARAGMLISENTFAKAAELFLKEYAVITEGDRSERWTEGHGIRLRVHLLPFFGALGLSQVTPGKVQEYRVHRMGSRDEINPHSKSNRPPSGKPPARSTLHNEIVTLRQVLKTAVRHGWLAYLPDLSPPYRTQGKVVHRPWFSPAEYKQLYEASRAYAREPFHGHYAWNAEQVHDYILFLANTGLRPDEARNLEHRDVEIVEDDATGERILEIEVRGKRGVGYCKSMAGAVRPYERLLARPKPGQHETRREAQRRRRAGLPEPEKLALVYPEPTDKVFPGNHVALLNGILDRAKLKVDRDGKRRTAYSLRHTYICMRLMEGADIYQIAKNCRTSVEMIEKFYAAHIKTMLDAASINVRRPKKPSAKAGAHAQAMHED
ncbi:site-specific integrase [Rhizorhabdus argentea]|uniref:site-specific integrase n=1 Tax=Rhizorhabdus argentea TaxID=1387174 RepID=UPI0030EC6663